MPPKKSKATKAKKEPEVALAQTEDEQIPKQEEERKEDKVDNAPVETETNGHDEAPAPAVDKPSTSKKRKADGKEDKQPTKASRRSVRGAKAEPSQLNLLNFLLSDKAADLCRPEDEIKELEQKKDLRTYSSTALSPFEELLCAIVLSRPISHRLGLRSIRTILNAPYNLTSPKAIKDIGPEKVHQAMLDARTQHKEKTASVIGLIADVVGERFGKNDSDTSLDKLRDEAGKDWDSERDLLQQSIKGLGKTGLDIFYRRVQWLWPEAYPFVDERTARGLEKLGLPKHPEKLVECLNEHWDKLDTSGLVNADKEAKKRRAFVVVCERASGSELEGKSELLLETAASSSS